MNRLELAFWEADRHWSALAPALEEWRQRTPPSLAAVETNDQKLRLLDQILFRFARLQDCFGERLVPATLEALSEPFEAWPMRDRLERLDRIGFLRVEDWLRWRELRNRLSHEYPDQPELRWAGILAAVEAASQLGELLQRWRAHPALRP